MFKRLFRVRLIALIDSVLSYTENTTELYNTFNFLIKKSKNLKYK
jgi:hypothetical protein